MKRIAIISPLIPTPSETFINAHLNRLPFEVHHFHSLPKMGYHPVIDGKGNSLSLAFKPWYFLETAIDNLLGHSGAGYAWRKYNLRKYLTKYNIEAVLAEYGPTGTHVMDVCARLRIPLVVHFHGRDAYHYKTISRYRARFRRMFKIAFRIIAVSQDMQRQLVSLGAPEDKLIVNPYGPNPDIFKPSSRYDKDPVFLFVGRLTGKKAPHKLIRAFAPVVRDVPEAKLVMAGTGELKELCQLEVQNLGLEEHVEFAGLVNPEQVSALHDDARVYVQHSVRADDGDSEGTPVAILEAMASGLPVISTRHAGIADVVIENETGFLVDEHDIEGMSNYMIALAKDPQTAHRMGAAGTRRISEKYTMERHLGKLEEILQAGIAQIKQRDSPMNTLGHSAETNVR